MKGPTQFHQNCYNEQQKIEILEFFEKEKKHLGTVAPEILMKSVIFHVKSPLKNSILSFSH